MEDIIGKQINLMIKNLYAVSINIKDLPETMITTILKKSEDFNYFRYPKYDLYVGINSNEKFEQFYNYVKKIIPNDGLRRIKLYKTNIEELFLEIH